MATNTVDVINAVAGLWKLVFAIALLVAAIVFREPLHKALSGLKNLRIKRGQTEVSVEGSAAEEKPERTSETKAAVAPEPDKPDRPKEPTSASSGDFYIQMHRAFLEERLGDAEEAFNCLQEAEESPNEKLRNEATYLFLRYRYANDANAIARLEKIAENAELRATVLSLIGLCHEYSRSYAKAIAVYRRSLAGDVDEKVRAEHTVRLAKCLVHSNNTLQAVEEITSALGRTSGEEGRAALYQGLADIYEVIGDTTLRAIALQKVLQFTADDTNVLFSSAYSLSQVEISALSATNYSTLLRFKPKHSSALNNLGVWCEKLGLPLTGVSYYRRSAEQKETLAMANLAYLYMDKGFEKEAREILDQAMRGNDPHKNVGSALASLAERREKEDKEWESIKSLALKEQQFFWDYADAYFEPCESLPPFAGVWISSEDKLFSLSLESDRLTAKWETESEGEEIQGSVCRRAAQIKCKKKAELIDSYTHWSDDGEGFGFLSVDGMIIRILVLSKNTARFLTLTRKTASGEKEDVVNPKCPSS